MKISTTVVTLFILIQNVIGSSPGQPSTTSTPSTTPLSTATPTPTTTPTTTITTTSTTATSTTTTTPEPTTTTDILPPKSIQLENISTTGFTINIDQASFPSFNIKINDTEHTNITTNHSIYKINYLIAGTCYRIELSTVVRDQFSKAVIQNICLPPSRPKLVLKLKTTNDSITINIAHGIGKMDYFEIFVNGIYNSRVTPNRKDSNSTITVVQELIPGTLYNDLSVLTVTNGLNSTLTTMDQHATYPDPPINIEVIEPTNNCCISLNITQGFGKTESFHVYVNDTQNFTTCIVSNDEYTICNISNLLPGRIYQIQVAAFSNDMESVKESISGVTKPNAPQIKITTTSTTTKWIFGTISQMDGGSDTFQLFCAENPNLNFSINHSDFFINDLEPGHRYHIQATATFHNHTSDKSELIPVCTVPHKPEITVDKTLTSTTMIQGTILQTIGGNDSFTLYEDDVKYSKYTITKSSFVIRDLNPAQNYKIQATTTFCSLESVKTDPIEECTVPTAPELIGNVSTATTTTLSGCILQENSERYKFNLYCNETKELHYNITGSDYKISSLEPGHRYHLQATTSLCSHSSEQSKQIEACTVPYQPMFQIDSNSTTTKSISGTIHQIKGGNDNFTLYCGGQTKLNYTIQGDKYSINDLEPGERYSCQATSAFCKHTSARTNLIEECTVPYPPNFEINSNSTMTTSILGTIRQTKGGNDNFTLYCEGHKLSYTIDGDKYRINNLEPGHRYRCQASSTFCHHTSTRTSLIKQCTAPYPPSFEIDNKTTTKSISGTIHNIKGGYDNFTLYCEGQTKLNYTIQGDKYRIHDLEAGERYRCQASSTFCQHTSTRTNLIEECTVPYQPSFEINSKSTTTKSISGTIRQTKGGSDKFTLYCEDQTKLNYTIQGGKYRINNLKPGKRYSCQATATFCQHTSARRTNLIKECTVPSTPKFTINSPLTTTETISGSISLSDGGHDNFILDCDNVDKLNYSIHGGKYTIKNLIPGQLYKCQAWSTFCKHKSAISASSNESTVPTKPTFNVNKSTNETMELNITKGNGVVEEYNVTMTPVDADQCSTCQPIETKTSSYSTNKTQETVVNIRSLNPGTLYNISVTSVSNGWHSLPHYLQHATVPTKPTFDVNKSTNETMELNITKGNGVVEKYNVTMTPVDADQCSTYQPIETKTLSYSTNKTQETVVNIRSLNPGTLYNISVTSVSNGQHSLPHYLQHATDASPPLSVTTDIDKDSITFSITKGGGCVKYFIISIDGKKYNVAALKGKEMTRYTVNNLDPSTTYKVTVSVVSKGAETSRQISFKTKNDPVPVIGGVIGAVLALLVIGMFVVSWRRQAMCFRKNKSTEVLDGKTNIGFEEEVEMADSRKKRPVKLTDFPRHVEYLSRNANMGFAAEFKELGVLSPKHSTNAAQLQENRPKNRYTNILPFDSSIVKLVGADDEPGSDFINANFIPGKRSPREYIAAQGPLPATKEDMWSMIWEQNTSIVVMLTQIVERGRKKCEIYWPENLNEKMFLGDIIVEVETLSHLPDYVLRTIVLRLGDVEKRLRHYNYIAWPDMGTPATTDNMISFVDTVRKDIRPDMKGPIVVHCSAGVGRTGTFIVMDILLQEMRSQCKEVDIFGTILNLRNNRVNMVQTEDQYIFIHNCVRDFTEASDDEEEEVVDDEQRNEPIYQNV